MKNTLFLRFDNSRPFGSKEHFYHFSLGYLLPAVALILRRQDPNTEYQLQSCGPLMDKLSLQLPELLNIRITIRQNATSDLAPQSLIVPRWDVAIREFRYGTYFWERSRWRLLRSRSRRWRLRWHFRKIRQFRVRLLDRLELPAGKSGSGALLIRRSPAPAFYLSGGAAESPGYGTSRRALLATESTALSLRKEGFAIQDFEPGAVSLLEQITAFSQADSVIMMRGAEIANLIWLNPGSRVLILQPEGMSGKSPAQRLCRLLGHSYCCLPVSTDHVTLKPDILRPFLRKSLVTT